MIVIIDPETKKEIDFNIAIIERLDKINNSIKVNSTQLEDVADSVNSLSMIFNEDYSDLTINKKTKKLGNIKWW